MNFFKNKVKLRGFIGIALLILVIAGGYIWETYGRQALTYTDVIVFKKDVQENVIVTADMLGVMKLERGTLIENAITNPNKITGKETTTFIPSKMPLTTKFFANPDLTTGNNKYTFKIPEEWIYSYPQTIRRGDEIYIYPISLPDEVSTYTDIPTTINITYNQEKPLLKANVVYVKDSSNREVVNTGSNRYDGSANVAQIEIITTEEKYNILTAAYQNGYKFNILYK